MGYREFISKLSLQCYPVEKFKNASPKHFYVWADCRFFASCLCIKHPNLMDIMNSVRKFNLYTLTNGISGAPYLLKKFFLELYME